MLTLSLHIKKKGGPEDRLHTACCGDVSVNCRTSKGREADIDKPGPCSSTDTAAEELNGNSLSAQKKGARRPASHCLLR